ncbi:MAG: hypothetical protein CMJ22_02910 [Phycisphaerae bacterium]|nr:hypothetical protein [Phycisphaerae bacterium]
MSGFDALSVAIGGTVPGTRGGRTMPTKTTTRTTQGSERDVFFRLAMAATGIGLLLSILI